MSEHRKTLMHLRNKDSIVAAYFAEYERCSRTSAEYLPYDVMLERLCIALSEARETMLQAAIRAEMRSPPPPFTLPVQPRSIG